MSKMKKTTISVQAQQDNDDVQSTEFDTLPETDNQSNEEKTINIPITAIIALLVSLGALFLAWQNSKNNQRGAVKVVDLAEMSRFYQEQARQQGLKDGVSEAQRAQILQNLQLKMNVLQKSVDEYVQSCACNVWVKSAIVGRSQQVEDVTPIIMGLVESKTAQSTFVQPFVPRTALGNNMPQNANTMPSSAVNGANVSNNSSDNSELHGSGSDNLDKLQGGMSPAFPNQ